jgi:Na+-translocating ferredoxin:NAD+ oxidoreductase RnfD subunit
MLGWTRFFDYALWTSSNLSIFCALHLIVWLRFGAWGIIVSFIVMLAAAATLTVVAFSKAFGPR